MNLALVGVNFRTAPVEVREKMTFKTTDIPRVLRCIKRLIPDSETVILSTCNRTELYAAGPALPTYRESLGLLFAKGGNLWGSDDYERFLYRKDDVAAVEHLFSVAASLESMVLGEREILGQVKAAYALGQEAGTTGRILNPLFQRALKTAKLVQTKTAITRGHVSVGSVAVDFARRIFHDFATKTAIVVGAGQTAEATIRNLIDKGLKTLRVVNRSPERGRELADRYGGKAIQFDLLEDYLPQADIVISSTNAPHCVIHSAMVQKAIAARGHRPMLFLDLAVPRDVEEGVGTLPNVYLYNIDDLKDTAAEGLARRRGEVEETRSLVRAQARQFAAWFRTQDCGTLIRRMDEAANRVKEEELARAFVNDGLAGLPSDCQARIRDLLHRTVNRIVAVPKIAIREAAREGRGEEYIRALRRLCGLDGEDRHAGP